MSFFNNYKENRDVCKFFLMSGLLFAVRYEELERNKLYQKNHN